MTLKKKSAVQQKGYVIDELGLRIMVWSNGVDLFETKCYVQQSCYVTDIDLDGN